MNRSLITPEYLRAVYEYDGAEGVLRFRHRTKGRGGVKNPGDEVGWVNAGGYRRTEIDGHEFFVHTLVWAMEYGAFPPPGFDIDHIDGDRINNRLENLRLATRSQNNFNAGRRCDNKSGYRGVWYDRSRDKWDARCRINGRQIHLGRYDTPELARDAYRREIAKHHGDFMHPSNTQ